MKCPFCTTNKEIKEFNDSDEHLIILKKGDDYHIHGPVEDKNKIHELLIAASLEIYKECVENHLIIFKNKDKNFTIQSSIKDKKELKEFIFAICKRYGIGIKGK